MNENGTVVQYGADEEDYITDVLTAKAVDFIDRAEANDAQPFFLTFTPTAPHADSVPERPAHPRPAARRDVRRGDRPRGRRRSTRRTSATSRRRSGTSPLLTAAQIAAIDQRVPDPAGVAAVPGRGDRADHRDPGRPGRAGEHVHRVHLRQRLPPRPAPVPEREVPGVRGGHPGAADHPRPRRPGRGDAWSRWRSTSTWPRPWRGGAGRRRTA